MGGFDFDVDSVESESFDGADAGEHEEFGGFEDAG